MPRNKPEDLRNLLFAALERIEDAETEEELKDALQRGKGTAAIAAQINASSKNEISYLNLLARHGQMPNHQNHQHLLGKGKTIDDE